MWAGDQPSFDFSHYAPPTGVKKDDGKGELLHYLLLRNQARASWELIKGVCARPVRVFLSASARTIGRIHTQRSAKKDRAPMATALRLLWEQTGIEKSAVTLLGGRPIDAEYSFQYVVVRLSFDDSPSTFELWALHSYRYKADDGSTKQATKSIVFYLGEICEVGMLPSIRSEKYCCISLCTA